MYMYTIYMYTIYMYTIYMYTMYNIHVYNLHVRLFLGWVEDYYWVRLFLGQIILGSDYSCVRSPCQFLKTRVILYEITAVNIACTNRREANIYIYIPCFSKSNTSLVYSWKMVNPINKNILSQSLKALPVAVNFGSNLIHYTEFLSYRI